jgi:hypothetical protein
MSDTQDPRSVPELLSTFTSDFVALLRKESELVRSEFSEKVGQIAKGGAEMAGGAICLLAALLVLLQALVIALSKIMDPVWASILVGVAVAILGVVLLRAGAKAVEPSKLTPDRSARQLGKDAALAKDQVK